MTSDRLSEARTVLEVHRAGEREKPPSLFDALEQRDAAIASTEDSHRGELLQALDAAVERVAAERDYFTVDDLRDELARSRLDAGVDLKVLGAILRGAARRGLIRAVGFTPSRYRHASPVRVWEVCDAA